MDLKIAYGGITKKIFRMILPSTTWLFTFCLIVSGCQSGNDLAGTWTGTKFSFEQTQGPDISAMIRGGEALHIGGQLILNEDNSYQIKNPEGSVNGEGTWTKNDPGSFTTTDSNGETTVYTIQTLNNSSLVTKHSVNMSTPDGDVSGEITLSYERQ